MAKEQFGFEESDRVKLHIENGLKFVETVAAAAGKSDDRILCRLISRYSRKTQKHINIYDVCWRIMRCAAAFLFLTFMLLVFIATSIFVQSFHPFLKLSSPHFTDASQQPRYDVVLFDVDSKDSTVGMSCPPRSFVAAPFVAAVRDRVLKPEGIFVRFLYQELLYVRFT